LLLIEVRAVQLSQEIKIMPLLRRRTVIVANMRNVVERISLRSGKATAIIDHRQK
jgi:hypothetical protein